MKNFLNKNVINEKKSKINNINPKGDPVRYKENIYIKTFAINLAKANINN